MMTLSGFGNRDLQRRSFRPPKRDIATPVIVAVVLISVCTLGWVLADQYLPGHKEEPTRSAQASPRQQNASGASRVHFSMCGRQRYTCIVDGDTIWLNGENLRLRSFDTPEPHTGMCGGAQEVALAKRASARLLQLLNGNPITVQTFGLDNTGKRTLATITIAGRDVGDILIEERLARAWPDGDEWWC